MCGLAGEFLFRGQPQAGVNWDRIGQLMYTRGPDDSGFVQGSFFTLQFRRLSILDLSPAGHQPMQSPNQKHHLCFNGELYNYKELKRELEHLGFKFMSKGDTEVVLNSLIQWGALALEKFNGMFALAYINELAGQVLLAVDHCGIKPLYYHYSSEGVFFSSQLNQVPVYQPQVSINPEGLNNQLRFGFCAGPETLYNNTYSLMPGQAILFNRNRDIKKYTYWSYQSPRTPPLQQYSYAEKLSLLSHKLTESIRRQSHADVPLNTFLSGGVDSSLVCSHFTQDSEIPITAYTFEVQGDPAGEVGLATQTAQSLGLSHKIITLPSCDLIDSLDPCIATMGEPLADISYLTTYQVCKAAGQNSRVMLSGDGGDEPFYGYPGRMYNALQFDRPAPLLSPLYRLLKRCKILQHNLPARQRYKSLGLWYQEVHSIAVNGWQQKIFPDLRVQPLHPLFEFESYWKKNLQISLDKLSGPESKRQAIGEWVRYNEIQFHLRRVLLKVDRASMAHSLEVRVPLLDKEVLEISKLFSMQDCFAPQGAFGKKPLRDLLNRKISYPHLHKKGFDFPLESLMKSHLETRIRDTLGQTQEIFGIPLAKKARDHLLECFFKKGQNYSYFIWNLLIMYEWEKQRGRSN